MTQYRLRGEVGGTERSYPVPEGELRVGCVGSSDIVLPVRGVSRSHGRLLASAIAVEVEDLDSRNGVFVNGARVRRGRLHAGDEVRFGPVALRLEEVPAEEAELAIRVDDGERPPAGLPSWETTSTGVPVAAGAARRMLFPEDHVPGTSPRMRTLYEQMRPLADSDLPVLVMGETGVGKEHVARALHASSPRRSGPFIAINCAAIPAELLEAEMFGIAKGAATGVSERAGKLTQASGGTLFLDEIGEMPAPLQPKLLRALQEKQVQPVGGAPASVDVRTVAATNADLQAKLDSGAFRRDLYFRVAGFVLRVPPLRERREDIPGLVEAFLRRFAREDGRAPRGVTARALTMLRDHAWPGNVRELEHEMRRMVHLCPDGQAIESSMLAAGISAPAANDAIPDNDGASLSLETHLQRLEDRLIREALRRTQGNRSEAARLLGISRNGLALKMERLGIEA